MQNAVIGNRSLIFSCLLVLCVVGSTVSAEAATATWSKNTESDMKDYGVYMCFTRGCAADKSAANLQSYVSHSATVNPSFPIPPNTEGGVAVSARDTAGNESGVTVTVPFDQAAPKTPASLTVQ